MAANITYKCPTCGAELYYTASKKAFECEYCGDCFTLEQMKNEAQEGSIGGEVERHEEILDGEYTSSNDGTVGSDLVKYSCSHCGAEIITDRATAATVCVYCGSPVIMGEQITEGFKPDYLIPFKYEKSTVMETFKKFSKKPLTPKDFDCDKIVDKLQGVYIPFWLYSAKCSAKVNAECKKIKTRHVGNNRTERIEDIYHVYRAGEVDFKLVPVDASQKTDNDAMDSIEPYDYNEIVPFDPGYLSGYLAERYDEDKDTCYARAKERIEHSTLEAVKATCNYNTFSVLNANYGIKVSKVSYALMPTWLLYTTYKDKNYLFAMNGQTGKFIGNLPIDKFKLTLFSLLGGVAGSIICSLILPFFFY